MSVERGGRAVLGAKLAYTAVELAVGVALVLAALTHHDVTALVRGAAHRELREDPADFVARHALALVHPIPLRQEGLAGIGVAVYALVKGVLVVAILRGSRRAAVIGAVAFCLVAAVALVVLVCRPSVFRVLIGALDLAVAAVVIREARPVAARTT